MSHRDYRSRSRRGKRRDSTGTKLLTQLLCGDLFRGVFQTILRGEGMILAVHTWIGGHVGIWMFACVLSCLKAIRTWVLNSKQSLSQIY